MKTEMKKMQALLEKGFVYEYQTGIVYQPNGLPVTGKKLGWSYIHTKVEIYGVILDTQTYSHRFAYFYMTGELPQIIDHINRNRSDNRWSNLRDSDYTLNARNRSQVKGFIIQDKEDCVQFLAHIYCKGKRIALGTFNTPTEAYVKYYKTKHGELPSKEKIYRMLNNLN